jgi:hypothetical protein
VLEVAVVKSFRDFRNGSTTVPATTAGSRQLTLQFRTESLQCQRLPGCANALEVGNSALNRIPVLYSMRGSELIAPVNPLSASCVIYGLTLDHADD